MGNIPVQPHDSADPAAALLLRHVAARDVACPTCGYNLRALLHPRCPECGTPLALQVSLADPKLASWLLILVPVLFGSGLAMLLVPVVLLKGPASGTTRLPILLLALNVPAAVYVMAHRRALVRLPQVWRAALAVGAILLFVGPVLMFVLRAF